MTKIKNLTIFERKQAWHVCWVMNISGRDISYGDGTCTMNKKLTADSIKALRDKLAQEMTEATKTRINSDRINITSLTRIGI